MLIITALIFIGLILGLVLVHEFGHFITAKWAGCNVEEFGFGFPPRIASWDYNGTKYSLNLLPIGGFVKIEGEDMSEDNPGSQSFATKPATWRIIILAAGVVMNVVFAFVLLTVEAGIGFPTLITEDNQTQLADHQTYILEVAADSPASQAGIQDYDRITQLDTINQPTISQIQAITKEKAGQAVTIHVNREGVDKTFTVTPRVNPPDGQGALGISLAATGLQRVPWWQAPWYGLKRTYTMIVTIISQLGVIIHTLIQHGSAGTQLTGPIGIAIYTNEAAKMGVSYVLEFGALISLNLALVNILPLPALDGGRILFVVIEKLRGRRLSLNIEQWTHTIGFGLLIVLMILITLKDIKRFF